MRITDVEAFALSSPIEPPQQREFHGGQRTILKRDVILTRVVMADGTVGVAPGGASSSAMREYFAEMTQDTFVDVINDIVAPTIVGEEVTEPGAGFELLTGLNLPDVFRMEAQSMVDIALHDIFGKAQGVPVYELLPVDQPPTPTLSLYASGGMYMPPEQYAREAREVANEGFFGYKYRPGIGPEGDKETIRRIVDEVGDEIAVMVDAHTWWKMDDASYGRKLVEELVEYYRDRDVYWVEEPVKPADHDDYGDLHRATGAPLAGGESEKSVAGLLALADTGAVDFLQGDVRHHGGFTGCWQAVEHCREMDVTYVPHNFGTHLGLVANGHLTAAAPDSHLLEYPLFERDRYPGMYPFPLAKDILQTDLDINDGTISLPDEPGLGVTVDMDVVEEYPYREGPWTEFNYD